MVHDNFFNIFWSGMYYFLDDGGLRRKEREEKREEVRKEVREEVRKEVHEEVRE